MKLHSVLFIFPIIHLLGLQGADYPATPPTEKADIYHGVVVHDPYRWLEDSENPRVREWEKEQHSYFKEHQRGNLYVQPLFKAFSLMNSSERTTFYAIGQEGRILSVYQDPELHAPIYYIQENAEAPLRMILDVNQWKGEFTVDFEIPSPDGRVLAFGISQGGDEAPQILLYDTLTLEKLPDAMAGVKQEDIVWTLDSKGFYYTAFPNPGEVSKEEEFLWQKVFYHTLGTGSSFDPIILEDTLVSDWWHSLYSQGSELHIWRMRHLVENGKQWMELFTQNLGDPLSQLTKIYETDGEISYRQMSIGKSSYSLTNDGAENFRLLKFTENGADEIIPERKELLLSVVGINQKIAALYREHGHHAIYIYSQRGLLEKKVPLPGPGIVEIDDQDGWEGSNIYLMYQSLTEPPTLYEYNEPSNRLTLLQQTEIQGYDPANFETKQTFVQSADGALVPVHLAFKKNTPVTAALLTGYGGFRMAYPPQFNVHFLPWIQSGGIVCLAHLRGGEEYGERWHREGCRKNKQNVFNDFIAAAEFLTENYVSPQKLAITGKSNGGLLTSAVITQKPFLCRAAVSSVPLTDMIRYPNHRLGALWIGEYGSPEMEEYFHTLIQYSPYHNVLPGTPYPSTLITTGLNDRRVDPLHARKMAAKLQNADPKGEPHLLSVDENSGHMYHSPINRARRVSEEHGFLMQELGFELTFSKPVSETLDLRQQHFMSKLKKEEESADFMRTAEHNAVLQRLIQNQKRKNQGAVLGY